MHIPVKNKVQSYLDEIEGLCHSGLLHSDNSDLILSQVRGFLKKIKMDSVRNNLILNTIDNCILVFNEFKNLITFNKKAGKMLSLTVDQSINKNIDLVFKNIGSEIAVFVNQQINLPDNQRKSHTVKVNDIFICCCLDQLEISGEICYLISLADATELFLSQKALKSEQSTLERQVKKRTLALEEQVDIKEIEKQQAKKMALTDTLTNLPNRRAFLEILNCVAKRSRDQTSNKFAILFIDLDGFKLINDTLGHSAGDILLIAISKCLKQVVRGGDVCARLGGNEFVVMLHGVNDKEILTKIINNLLSCIAEPVYFNKKQKMQVSGSIGVYLSSTAINDASTILTMADEAMYEAKSRGKDCFVFFDDQLKEKMQHKKDILQLLDDAFVKDEFMVYYQPICDINGSIIAMESLARWQHNGNMIPPDKFIPLLEERGTIKGFTYFVIEKVYLTLMLNEHFPPVSINLSMQQFYDKGFIKHIKNTFQNRPDIRKKISFEITESLFHKDPQMLQQGIEELRNFGFKIYIDDFGTGYSSFAYIRNFKADVVKIDRAFVIDIESNKKNADLLRGMISLLLSMDMDVVIEGVEIEAQIKQIKACSDKVRIQGYYYYRPMPLDDVLAVLAAVANK